MAWKIEYAHGARQQLRKMDRRNAMRILDYMDEQIAPLEDSRTAGKALTGPLGDFWRYRVGDYRIICHIQDDSLLILVLRVGKRSDIYHR